MKDNSSNSAPGAPVQVLAVEPEAAGQRLDRYLAVRLAELSRTRIQELIKQGRIRIGGKPTRPSQKVSAGERIEVEAIPRPPLCAVPEPIPLEILYEDADVIAVNKPAGMAVHPATGCATGTLVNALLHRYGQLSSEGGELRPGIVHRLDKATSGVVLVARNDTAHRALADQFRHREVKKIYVALLHGKLKPAAGRIELPVARDLHRRTRMTTRRREGRAARTDWRTLLVMDGFTLVEAGLHTGRTHQIRVHFSALGHPVVGDTLYGAPRQVRAGRQTLSPLGRNFLHAARITFVQPRTGAPVTVRAPLPSELCEYLHRLAAALRIAPTSVDRVLRNYL